MPTQEPVLAVDDLSVSFRPRDPRDVPVQAVDGVSFSLAPGEVLAIVGESGCGKSVTSTATLGLLPDNARTTGAITLNPASGAPTDLLSADERALGAVRGREIAMIFQEPMTSLNPVLTVGRQITEVLRRHQGLKRREARARAVELLELVGIPAPDRRIDEYPHQLSGGMRQRVMIAVAVACDPSVLIADEPTTALDVTVQAGILDVLRSLRERLGTAIVLVTHDLGVVADIADRVLVMYAGRVVERGGIREVFAAPRHPYTRGLLDAVLSPGHRPEDGRLREIPGMVPRLSASPDACTFAARCGHATDRCRELRPRLDAAEDSPADGAGHAVACWHPLTTATPDPEPAV
jgi:peptide/nickel transport system ATP-binding protein